MDFQAEFENLKFKTTGILIDGSAAVALQSTLHFKAGAAKLQCAFTSVTYSTVASRGVIWIWTIVHKAEGADP